MTESKLTPKLSLEVGGSPVDAVLAESVIVVRVHMHLELADCLELRLSNTDLEWTEGETLVEGTEISVSLGYEETSIEKLFVGEIVRRDCEFPVRGPAVVTLVCLDKQHKLKKGKHGKVWLDAKDSDIVSEIAGAVGLSADVDATQATHKWVFQSNETHLSFIRQRAALNGYIASVDIDNQKLLFKKPPENSSATTLKWGENLLSFRPRVTSDNQVSKVTVRGWDMQAKEMVEGTADTSKIRLQLSGKSLGASVAEGKYGNREMLVVNTPVSDASQAAAMAESAINAAADMYCTGNGSCQGDPALVAGAVVMIEGVGERFGGEYFLSEAMHHFEPKAGYSVQFAFKRSTEKGSTADEQDLPPTVTRPESEDPEKVNYVEIKIRSQTGDDLTGLTCKVTLPNGEVQNHTLGEDHILRIEGIRDPGEAKIEFDVPEEMQVIGDDQQS